ncbi:cytochrome oxidase assembly protein-domain-containing protein [Cladochytrium replicatum]|nr:cytochrome oxidase assembly protein-domain-containing protein [Cladochytrium replicatum]
MATVSGLLPVCARAFVRLRAFPATTSARLFSTTTRPFSQLQNAFPTLSNLFAGTPNRYGLKASLAFSVVFNRRDFSNAPGKVNIGHLKGALRTHASPLRVQLPYSIILSQKQALGTVATAEKGSGSGGPTARPIVGYWMLFSASLVFGIIVLGGLTRLTESGLSITEWKPVTGALPPRTQEEWNVEFEKYKNFPEFIKLKRNMTLDEFKFIFYMEWAHRNVGRLIGVLFAVPFAFFALRKGYMTKPVKTRSFIITGLIGFQGLLGWLMVSSGLQPHLLEDEHAVPRVSHYWLAAHLSSAVIIYSLMFRAGVDILRSNLSPERLQKIKSALTSRALIPLRPLSHICVALVFFTIVSGALVAGLDAGLIYNEFPKMGLGIMPSDMWNYSKKEGKGRWWVDLLENPSAVQFDHRVMGITTLTAVSSLWLFSRRIPLPPVARTATNLLLLAGWGQVALGITTLLYMVPIPVAAMHQAGSVTLLTAALWLTHVIKRVR